MIKDIEIFLRKISGKKINLKSRMPIFKNGKIVGWKIVSSKAIFTIVKES